MSVNVIYNDCVALRWTVDKIYPFNFVWHWSSVKVYIFQDDGK